jgi:serpin B
MTTRRDLLRWAGLSVMAVAGAGLLTACGDGVAVTHGPTAELDLAMSSVRRESVAADAAASAAAAADRLAATLYGALPATGDLAFSPLSVAVALAMAAEGARGATRSQLLGLLGVADQAALDRSMNALTEWLTDQHVEGQKQDAQPVMVVADALFGQRGTTFEPAFLDALARDYGAGMRLVDYAGDAAGAIDTINAWVSDRTHDLIPALVPAGAVDPMTRLVLVNALYLLAQWTTPFADPTPGAFHLADGSTATVPMMARGEAVGRRGDGWTVATLSYVAKDLAMTLVVPDAGRLDEVGATVAAHGVAPFVAEAGPTSYDVTMPVFSVDSSVMLGDLLAKAGAPLPFSDDADFSGMTEDDALHISQVVHQAVVKVDQHGTQAAAATAVIMEATSAHLAEPLVVDRPFLFVIHDQRFGTPLFVGRVTDPR